MSRRLALLALLALGPAKALADAPLDVLALPTRWRTEAGGEVALEAWRGRWYVLSFVYTSCAGSCPLTTAKLRRLEQALARAGRPLDTVVVSLDPAHDTPRALQAYRARFHLEGARRWHLLVGEAPALRTLTMLLGFHFARNPASGAITHDNAIYLVGPDGTVRASMSSLDEPLGDLVKAAAAGARP